MRRTVSVVLLLLLCAATLTAQEDATAPAYLEADERILLLKEYLRQDSIELEPSFRMDLNDYYADVYIPSPPEYFYLAPSGSPMQFPSRTHGGHIITLGPNDLYMAVIYDFEHNLVIDAGEWKDLNGNFIAEPNEWFDENGNGVREFGEWTDVNQNGIVDLNELNDANGNGVFDIGEWHEGKNTNADPRNDLPGEFNGAVDPTEWIGMNRDRSITKKLAIKIFKRISVYYKEIDYQEYIYPSFPTKIIQHPALASMTTLTTNQKSVVLLQLDDCERCEIVGDVVWFEDEFARIVFNFQGFFKETLHTTLPRCEGCYEAEISHYVKLQVYMHEKFDLLYDSFFLHSMERRGLPDNTDGTTAYYYTADDEREKPIRSMVSFDPYYLAIRDNNELVLFETVEGKALIVPYDEKEEYYSSHIYTRKYPDGTEKDIRVELIHVYQIETVTCEQIIVARLLIDTDTQMHNTSTIDPDEDIYTVFYYACDDRFENNLIFPEEYERGLTDFAIIIEKVELENEKVYLKFVREVETERLPSPGAFPYEKQDYQIVFDNLDRNRPKGCDFYEKNERNIPRFEKILVDVSLPIRDLLNNVVLKYEDLKGDPAKLSSYEEQPWEMSEWNTEVTQVQLRKVAYNPNAADYTALGYADYPAIYVPPLDPAPGLVQVGPDLIPNFQVSDETFSGTCAPGDTITFLIEVYNGSGAPMSVLVEDDIPAGMTNPANVGGFPAGTIDPVANTITWNLPGLAPGYTLLAYQADVLADGSVNFGRSITNSGATIHYFDAGIPRTQTAPPVTINVQAAQVIKEVFQDVACTIPAPIIVPGSRLYYRLTVYNSIDPLSPNPFTALITEVNDAIPAFVTDLQPMAAGAPYVLPIPGSAFANTGTAVTWTHAGYNLLPGTFINAANRNATHSVFVPLGSAGRVVNGGQMSYTVGWPPLSTTTVNVFSNEVTTYIQTTLTQKNEPLEPCLTMQIEKEGPPIQSTGTVSYTIRVTNQGGGPYADAYNLKIIDKIPEGMNPPFNITASDPLVTSSTHDTDGDGTIDTIVWSLNQMGAGDVLTLNFDVDIEYVHYNCFLMKVFTYNLYRQDQDRYLGMGGLARSRNYTVTPEDMMGVTTDAVFTQVMKGGEKLENYLIKIFESKMYDDEFYFDFIDFNEKERSARFRLFNAVEPDISANVYWGVLEKVAMETGSQQIYSDDTFLAHVLLRNDGDGCATQISYELDAPDFSPVDMTWIYDVDKKLKLEIAPEEQAGLFFLMKAPSVNKETTFPVKVKITYSDGRTTRTDTKTVYLNVLSQRRASISLKKTILEGKSTVKETGKEVADMRVGEERTIVAFVKNLSDTDIEQVHYIDQIPEGLEVIEGDSEWMGTLKQGDTVKVTYKIRVKQIGVYQFRGKTFYKDERDHVYEGVSNITEIRVVTDPGPKLHREIDSTMISKGDTLTVVVRVENETPNPLDHIQVVDIIPEGFVVESLETQGLKQDGSTIRYYIDNLKSDKYILLKYTLRAGEKAGKFTYKGVRLAYENGDGLKEEVVAEDATLMIPETESPSLAVDYIFKRMVDADGEYVTVILNLPNMGGIPAKNIKINTPLPEGTQLTEVSTDYLQEGNTLTLSVDEVNVGETYTVKYTFKVPHFNQDKTYDLAFNTLYSDDFDREYQSERGATLNIKSEKPNLKITKVTEKSAVKLNFSLRVAINVINEGEIPALAYVTDPLPEGMVLLSGTNTWEGRLEPGESAQIIYEMLCTRVGIFSLPPAQVEYQDKWKTTYTAQSEQLGLNIKGIMLQKSSDVTTLKVGEVVVVTVTVTNTYDEQATNVSVRDFVPSEFTLMEGETEWNIGILKSGEEMTFSYSLKASTVGSFNLGGAKATFIDVYNDKHESASGPISILIEEMVKPEEEVEEIPTEETKEAVEKVTERLARSFDLTLILVIFLIMAISMVLAFLLIERRRTEEEELLETTELPPVPAEREVIWKKKEEEKHPLPTPEERAEAAEEDTHTPLDILKRRREAMEEKRGTVEKVRESRDIHQLLEKETEESSEAETGTTPEQERSFEGQRLDEERETERPAVRKPSEVFERGGTALEGERERDISESQEEDFDLEKALFGPRRGDLGIEDIFAEEKEEKERPEKSQFTDVHEITGPPKREEKREDISRTPEQSVSQKRALPEWEKESGESGSSEKMEIPDIRDLIKGPRKKEEGEKKKDTSKSQEDFDPRDIVKGKD